MNLFIKCAKLLINYNLVSKLIDFILLFLIVPSASILKFYRMIGANNLKKSTKLLKYLGIFPIRNHYYEPQFKFNKDTLTKISKYRKITGINLNISEQLKLLKKFKFHNELLNLELEKNNKKKNMFNINNSFFGRGDAEILYQMIRYYRPKKIIEIGSGHSTLIALEAIKKNNFKTDFKCIEPYENLWLENLGISIIRKKIEDINYKKQVLLNKNDILFIDSSHIIKPGGDILKIYLEIIPFLRKGVIVHVHDIFTPKNYLQNWINDHVLFWNEQYLLEALLSDSNKYKIICSLNFLQKKYYNQLKRVCPYIQKNSEPSSFYFKIC